MAKNSFQFDVALGRNNYIPIGEVKQSDTMDFSIRVLENDVVKNLTGDTCTLYVSKQDGTILEQKEGINITEATSGTLTIRVKNQATACPGMTFFELEFKGSDGVATSGTFLFTVNARVASGEAIQSKDEIHALEQVEKYVKEAKAELQKFKELQASMLETNNSINSQEVLRVEAESLRAVSEEGRVAAEAKREEAFNKFEGRITANTEELKNARSASTGEKFDTLDERIDHEVDRLNKKIDVTMLQQEDKESHVIENTVEGMTTNMVIKGKTLYKKSGGTYTDTWEEGVTLESFGEKEGNKISILSRTENLTPSLKEWEQIGQGAEIIDDFTFTPKETLCLSSPFVKCQGRDKLYFATTSRLKIQLFNESKQLIREINSWVEHSPCNISGSYYFKILTNNPTLDTNLKFYGCNFELFPDRYIVKKQDKKDILIKKPLKEGDYIYEDNGQVKVFRGAKQYTITGNENWIKALDNKEEFKTIHFQINLDDSYDFILNKAEDLLSNNFPSVGSLWSKDVEGIYKYSNNNLTISILKTKLTTPTVEGLKSWLKANPTDIIYNLATPNTEVVENCNNLNLKTYDEKTYVSFENAISGTSSFKAPVNAAATISRLNRENKALEEENLRLKKNTYKNSEDIILTNEELQITQSAVDHLLFGAVGTAMLYNGKKKGGGSMGAYLAMRIIKGKLKYEAVMKQYGEFKEDIDMILKAEGYGHLITQQ